LSTFFVAGTNGVDSYLYEYNYLDIFNVVL
jgi:hypothetical protein